MKVCKIIVGLLTTGLLLSSCTSTKKLTYLQYTDKAEVPLVPGTEAAITVTPSVYKLMPYDNLFIRIITPDPQWSELFNIVAVGAGGTISSESASLLSYPVDINGDIQMPFIGSVPVMGKNISQITSDLDSIFKNYVNDAAITVKMVNNYISIVGEVNMPGRYPITKDRINIFEALAMAGDLNIYSNRSRVQLIRPTAYGPVVKEFSLSDRSILRSEYYYLMPNDIIYAMPIKSKSFQMNSSVYSLIMSSITTVLLIWGFFR